MTLRLEIVPINSHRTATVLLGMFCAVSMQAQPVGDRFESVVKPLLKSNCQMCHNAKLAQGGLDIGGLIQSNAAGALKHREKWELIVQKLRSGEMPPKGMERPPETQINQLAGWVQEEYARLDRNAKPEPGRVTARRLNRYEYNNTVRDLLGIEYNPADEFPADDSGYGFDNNGDVLTVSPSLMQKYIRAAESIAGTLTRTGQQAPVKPTVVRYLAERLGQYPALREQVTHTFEADGEYKFRSTWYQRLPNGLPIRGTFFIDGKLAAEVKLTCSEEMDRAWIAQIPVPAGPHRVTAEITILDPNYRRAKPWLEYTEIQGPVVQRTIEPSEPQKKLFACGHMAAQHDASCPRRILTPLVRRAWRRPVTQYEVAPLLKLVASGQKSGGSLERGIGLALQAILVSPHFLFRIEQERTKGGSDYQISQHELASRLSYFLWSSTPDDELLKLADAGRLRAPGVLKAQVKRMLADAKSERLVENFGGQWLQIRNLESLKPDSRRFPEYDLDLRDAMRRETEMFLQAVVSEDRSVLDFIDGRFTYLNERLGAYYGIAGVQGSNFRRVDMDGAQRSGILTQAAILTVSSYPTRTSPVIRGKWVLENILGEPPPPPPPDVPTLDEKSLGTAVTVRQQLEKHRTNAVCASCHSRMDPLGFGLENYDAIGRWRTTDGTLPVDVTGALPNGKAFSTPAELKQILRGDKDAFVRCLAEKLLTFALGRGIERYDRPVVESIRRNVIAQDYRFSSVVEEIVNSTPFQMRRAAAQNVEERTKSGSNQ